jgi:hypothetical protein
MARDAGPPLGGDEARPKGSLQAGCRARGTESYHSGSAWAARDRELKDVELKDRELKDIRS